MKPEDKAVSDRAVAYVKQHQKALVEQFAGRYESQERPISIFLAGSPGAGMTEFSLRLVERLPDDGRQIVIIDPDTIRSSLPGYIHGKAELFQTGVAIAVEKIHDHALQYNKSFLLDGTLANLVKARSNIERSLKHNRFVSIQYVYQPPEVAWRFTQDREASEGRNIPRDVFIEQFIAAPANVAALKNEFGERVRVDVIVRDISKNTYSYTFNVDAFDEHLVQRYTEDDLKHLL